LRIIKLRTEETNEKLENDIIIKSSI